MPKDSYTHPDSILSETNYENWRLLTEAKLVLKDVWEVVNGSEERPSDTATAKLRSWNKKQAYGKAVITQTLPPKYLVHANMELASDIWTRLEELFLAEGHGSVMALRRQFHSMSYTEGPLRDYFSEVATLAAKLEQRKSHVDELNVIGTMTRGLPQIFHPVIVIFDTIAESTLTVPYVTQRLLNEEMRQTEYDADTISTAMISRERRGKGQEIGDAKKQGCFNCGSEDHLKFQCELSPKEVHERKLKEKKAKDSKAATPSREVANIAFSEFEIVSLL